ncbi:MAG: hypothetical protein HY787_17895 [Deltaproteobacteria bacterium]|nr:hypothetical protein [Deltaproteobacteria bacterium]
MENLSQEERNTKTAIGYLQHIVDGSGRFGKESLEYRISFKFNDQGKITRQKEFVDSLFTARFYGLIQET